MSNLQPIPNKRIFFFVSLLIVNLYILNSIAVAEENGNLFKSLQQILIVDGFDKSKIEKLYSDPEVVFDVNGVSRFFMHQEATLNYDQFTSKTSIQDSLNYMQKYAADLERTEKTFGVDKKIITAILLVETRLGTVSGKRSVFNSLSSIASLSDPGVREFLWHKISNTSKLTHADFENWVQKRSNWAYKELKAFIQYTDRENMNPLIIKGSFAGAMGVSQFMPSNILAYGKDGNSDNRIDLFDHADAIASIAGYLKHYGWHPEIDKKAAAKVIHHYNHSNYYVDTILKISELLKG
ncbi:MAG: lytic murein transglycosylase [Desulfobacterales bacterium]|nr:lytic murein transglycosylase [Desulfobacterales bacterium]